MLDKFESLSKEILESVNNISNYGDGVKFRMILKVLIENMVVLSEESTISSTIIRKIELNQLEGIKNDTVREHFFRMARHMSASKYRMESIERIPTCGGEDIKITNEIIVLGKL